MFDVIAINLFIHSRERICAVLVYVDFKRLDNLSLTKNNMFRQTTFKLLSKNRLN